jgi:hypothetical protein
MSHLLLSVMGAFAQFERDLILERQAEGIALPNCEWVHMSEGSIAFNGRSSQRTGTKGGPSRNYEGLGTPLLMKLSVR